MDKVPADLDAIVVGSGIGGMSTAAIMAKAGKRVLVLEQHDQVSQKLFLWALMFIYPYFRVRVFFFSIYIFNAQPFLSEKCLWVIKEVYAYQLNLTFLDFYDSANLYMLCSLCSHTSFYITGWRLLSHLH